MIESVTKPRPPWQCITPFGPPVEPEVCISAPRSSAAGISVGGSASLARSSRLENQDAPSTASIACVTSGSRTESQRSIAASERCIRSVTRSCLAVGLIGMIAAPARSVAWIATTASTLFGSMIPTRSPRWIPCSRMPAATRSVSSCSSPKLTSRSSTTSATRPGSRAAFRARSSAVDG